MQPASQPSHEDAGALAHLLYYLLVFVAVFLFGSYAIMRASRRFRDAMTARPIAPTPTPDIWSMHKLPQGNLDSAEDDTPNDGPDGSEDSSGGPDGRG